jgi:hypothetical protein
MIVFHLGRKKEAYDLLNVWAEALRFVRCSYTINKVNTDYSYVKIGDKTITKGTVDDFIYLINKVSNP